MSVKVLVLTAAGTNCDQETKFAFELVGARAEIVHINQLKSKDRDLQNYQIFVLPGGFTYGDYIAAGRILANELRFALRADIENFIEDGKLILGICNGFQVLVKAGILPALPRAGYFSEQTVTLEFNNSNRYEDRWVWLKPSKTKCIFINGIEDLIYLPVAHAEGKFEPKNRRVLQELLANGQVVLRYSDPKGKKPKYPENPNGSVDDIAGICDPTGRVFGMMPHPERFVKTTQHPRWRRGEGAAPFGVAIFKNGVDFLR
jgi:phosphoribosylformylglycinamidine synthase